MFHNLEPHGQRQTITSQILISISDLHTFATDFVSKYNYIEMQQRSEKLI